MNHDEFVHRIAQDQYQSQIKGKTVLVALSGGADSVALLRVLLELGHKCHAAHCNFHLRGDESMRDEQFTRRLCKRLDVPLTVKDFDVTAWQSSHGGSVEMACRELRYQWFEQELNNQGCHCIAVAHHADDQVETFFLNLMRGTGTKGLAGMQEHHNNIWRPLLGVTRKNILDYLDSIGQDYVTDSTNAQNDFNRNRVRNVILPIIEQQFPDAKARVHKTMRNLADDLGLLDWMAEHYIPDYQSIDIEDLCSHPHASALLYHRIRHLGFNRSLCNQAIEAARKEHRGRQFAAGDHLLVVNRTTFSVVQQDNEQCDDEIPFDATAGTHSPVHISAHRGQAPFSPSMCCAGVCVAFSTQLLDCKRIILRHWRQGDRIQPFGMKGTKLVSDLFNDLKLDYNDKKSTWLLEADGQIIWVVGLRASALYTVPIGCQDYIILTKMTQ